MNPIILIPARLGATRLPNKPLALIEQVPMIVHVWNRAREAGVGPVAVACDDELIAQVIREAGGVAVRTRPDHESGSDRIFEALQTLDPTCAHDVIINVQGDMPTIAPSLIAQVARLLDNPSVDIGTLAYPTESAEDPDNPAIVKAVLSFAKHPDIARALYFTRAPAPSGQGVLYHHIGIYAYRRTSLERFIRLPQSSLEKREKLEQLRAIEDGMHLAVGLATQLPIGVDTPQLLEQARAQMRARKIN